MKPTLLLIAAAGLAFAADDDEAKRLPDGPGKDVVAKACLSCHGAGNFRKKRLAKDGWSEQVADMIDRGAQATDAQVDAVVQYLTENFGKTSRLYINTAPFEELKAVLGLTVAETQSLIAFRTEHGDFKSWEDVQKVPGVEPKKLEAKKESIAF
jgi:competence protein ComEA